LDVVGQHPPINQPGVRGHGFLPRDDAAAQAVLDTLFATATAFVLPSRFDPSPIAYLEAASAGLPVIATTEGGAGELLGSAAITVHPDDGPALVAALLHLADPEIARVMGAQAEQNARSASWSEVARRVLEALDLPVAAQMSGMVP
jgi:glycosyltransferase involved in cell wall biosynthesis